MAWTHASARAACIAALLASALPACRELAGYAPATDDGERCGAVARCPAGELCQYAEGDCERTGVGARCVELPPVCGYVNLPVCDCDKQQHTSTCEMLRAGGQLDYRGECRPDGGAPDLGRRDLGSKDGEALDGGIGSCSDNNGCPWGGFCKKSSCGPNVGQCAARPDIASCPPGPTVCGCDNLNYPSECAANAEGINVGAKIDCCKEASVWNCSASPKNSCSATCSAGGYLLACFAGACLCSDAKGEKIGELSLGPGAVIGCSSGDACNSAAVRKQACLIN
jgi:hypothetical protein